MTELDRIRERMRQNREARQQALAVARVRPPGAEAHMGCQVLPGTIVFDTVTGLEGEVIAGTVENVIVPTPRR